MAKKRIKTKKKEKGKLYKAAKIIMILLVLYIVLGLMIQLVIKIASPNDRTTCPYKVEGNANATFVVKYVDSPYCVWCWMQESVLKEAVTMKGDSFKLERYDIRYCKEMVRKYRFAGTPSFVFTMTNDTVEYPHSGYLDDRTFFGLLCKVTGDCR